MPLGYKPFDELDREDLAVLVDGQIPESMMLEYKKEPYGTSDKDKIELLKDVSALSNSSGGFLVIGIEEKEGKAHKLSPCQVNGDGESLRMEAILRTGIQPRIVGLKIRQIEDTSGGIFFLIKVPKSWNPPHRVTAAGRNRFYARSSSGVYEPDVDELRVLFADGGKIQDRVRAFRSERLSLIENNSGIMKLNELRSRLVLHIVPYSALSHKQSIHPEDAEKHHHELAPITSEGHSQQINFDGFVTFRGESSCNGYTQLFRSGIIEATKVGVARQRGKLGFLIPAYDFEKSIIDVVPKYLKVLENSSIAPPIIVMVSLVDIAGAKLGVSIDPLHDDPSPPPTCTNLELPEAVISEYATAAEYTSCLRPTFDALWNAHGYPRSKNFDASGNWIRRR